MAQELLHDAQGDAVGQLGREPVAKGMGRDAHVEAGGLAVALHQALHFAHGQAAVAPVLQQRRAGRGLETAQGQEINQVLDGLAGGVVKRDGAGMAALADGGRQVDLVPGLAGVENVADIEPHHFANPQASLGEKADERGITEAEGRVGPDLGEQLAGGRRVDDAHF